MAKLFLSYSSKDKQFTTRLADDLRRAGIDIWLYEHEIRVGDDIRRKIDQAITTHDFFGIVLSPSSIASDWIQQELSAALVKELNTRKITILPIKIADCSIPALISSKHYADFTKNYEFGLQSLLNAVGNVIIKTWALQGVTLATARRGHSEPPQRIATGCFSHPRGLWHLLAMIESIGNSEVVLEATSYSLKMLEIALNELDRLRFPVGDFMNLCFNLVNLGVKEINIRARASGGKSVGTKMALCMSIGNKVFATKLGACDGTASWNVIVQTEMDTVFKKKENRNQPKIRI